MKTLVIIPARLESKRFPNKPLTKIGDKTLIETVFDNVKKVTDDVLVATSNQEIAELFNDEDVVITGDAKTGSDRVAMAYRNLKKHEHYDLIINHQGDLINTDESWLSQIIVEFNQNNRFDVATFGVPLNSDDYDNKSCVKIFYNKNNKICFTREYNNKIFFKHIGIYAFTPQSLIRNNNNKQTENEILEDLEQIRFTENNMYISIIPCMKPGLFKSIDNQGDI